MFNITLQILKLYKLFYVFKITEMKSDHNECTVVYGSVTVW